MRADGDQILFGVHGKFQIAKVGEIGGQSK